MKPKALDLFCCAGGSGKGLGDSGFEVHGIDIEPQPEYPFKFTQEDAFELDPAWIADNYDFVWASPKCQKFAWGSPKHKKEKLINQIPGTLLILLETGLPFVIENVPNAPLREDLLLCGEMFKLGVMRHRIFQIEGFTIKQLYHPKHKKTSDLPIETLQNLPEGLITEPLPIQTQKKTKYSLYAQVAGHGGDGYTYRLEHWQQAMGIDWITDKEHLTQAIPPAYSKYIGDAFLR